MEKDRKDRIGELIAKLMASESDAEQSALALEITALSPDPNWSDYIFMSDKFVSDDGRFDIDSFLEEISSPAIINI